VVRIIKPVLAVVLLGTAVTGGFALIPALLAKDVHSQHSFSGLVLSVELSRTGVDFEVENPKGVRQRFGYQRGQFQPIDPAHLEDHARFGWPVEVLYEVEDRQKKVTSVLDLELKETPR
jgi:hypothetical protein